MNMMKKSIEKLINSHDYEAVFIGEMFAAQSSAFISDLVAAGLSKEEAELSIELFCERMYASISPEMDPLPFPNYRDELLDELKSLVHSYKEAC